MQLGDELVKEQLFFRKELRERVYWFIQLRWIAAAAALAGTWLLYSQWRMLPVLALNLIIFFIFFYNLLFHFIWRRMQAALRPRAGAFTLFAHTQMILDFFALYLLIYFTGSIYSPLLIFLIFHVVLAGILLSPLSCFLYCFSVLAVLGGLTALQWMEILPLHSPVFYSPLLYSSLEFPEILPPVAIFVAALFITAFLVTSLKLSLRIKGRELLRISKELDISNAKLTALYEMVTEMGGCDQLQDLMDSATKNATRIMGVKGCTIKLLDDQKEKLIFASTYGLSENYMRDKEGIDIAKSPINRRIIEGSLSSIGKIDERDYFQYPEDIRKEGIASMLCLPLALERMTLGVFCVYSTESYFFSEADVRFFSLMAGLTALSIENLKRELDKTWFLQKAAHQLRSPLNTIHSMLNTLRGGYLGPLTSQQEKTLNRSVKRLLALGDIVNDLLKFKIRQSDLQKKALHPVDTAKVLQGLIDPYKILAAEKKVTLTFHLADHVPPIQADEQLIDELFTNLISNAVKYTPPGGEIHVELGRETHDRIRFEVRDSGIGIAQEDMPRLFTEFFRSADARQFVEEGTGLGLVVVKEILNRLKGTISVKSKPGEGTCFTCRLPAFRNS